MAARSVAQLASMVQQDPALADEMKADPAKTLAKYAYASDQNFFRIAIVGLIAIIILIIVAAFVLEMVNVPRGQPEKSLPDWIAALAPVALGGLVGLFAPSPVQD